MIYLDASKPTTYPVKRWVIYRDKKPISGELYLGGAQSTLVILQQLFPLSQFETEELTVEPVFTEEKIKCITKSYSND